MKASNILAIDQGPDSSGVVVYNTETYSLLYHERAADNRELYEMFTESLSIQRPRPKGDSRKPQVRTTLNIRPPGHGAKLTVDLVILEQFANYGGTIGRSTIDSIEWGGMFAALAYASRLDPRRVCWLANASWRNLVAGRASATESQSKIAMRDWILSWCMDPDRRERRELLGGGKDPLKGIKSNPGPLFGVADHAWSALGMAIGYHKYQNYAELAVLAGNVPPPLPVYWKAHMQGCKTA